MNVPLFKTLEPFILASGSPRRQRFLAELGIVFNVQTAAVDEIVLEGEPPADFVRRMAYEKASAVAGEHPLSWVLGADTVVVLGRQILGKPDGEASAKQMLQNLSGRWHEVWTGFCLCNPLKSYSVTQAVKTEVRFSPLSDATIDAYIATGEPLDKAGSYGIQGRGSFLVEQIRGSYSNVVGLPMAEVAGAMVAKQIITPSKS